MMGWMKVAERLIRGRPPVGSTPAEVVFRENKWRLLRYRRSPAAPRRWRTPVLLVPSLINRHYVLDLLPGRSFAEAMVAAGHDVFLIDWGTPGPEDRYLTFDTICDRYLGRAIRATCRSAGTEETHLLGYCLGGTLTAIHAAARPERVASLTALAAPISFHDSGLLSVWTRVPTFDVDALVEAFGNVPWPLMQASFHLLKPTMNLAKLVQLVQRSEDDEFLDGFFAIETWGADNISFPGECYRRYIRELYQDNALIRGELTLSGRPARLAEIRCPTLAVTFEHDHIVPPDSAAVLLDEVSAEKTRRIHLPGGHVGAVVSKKAASSLWPQLSRWWAENEVPERAKARPAPAEVKAGPAEVTPAEVKVAAAEVKPVEVKPPEVKPVEVKAPEVKAPEVKAPEVKAPEVKAPEVKAPEVKATEVKAPEVKAPEVKAPETEVKATEVKPAAPAKRAAKRPMPPPAPAALAREPVVRARARGVEGEGEPARTKGNASANVEPPAGRRDTEANAGGKKGRRAKAGAGARKGAR